MLDFCVLYLFFSGFLFYQNVLRMKNLYVKVSDNLYNTQYVGRYVALIIDVNEIFSV